MNHSTWDLEVHAREMRQRWLREAERSRQIVAARQCGNQTGVSPVRFSISRLMTAFRDCLSPHRGSIDAPAAPVVVESQLRPIPVPEPLLSRDARSGALPQPYVGMVVLARGSVAPAAVQPCAAGDC